MERSAFSPPIEESPSSSKLTVTTTASNTCDGEQGSGSFDHGWTTGYMAPQNNQSASCMQWPYNLIMWATILSSGRT